MIKYVFLFCAAMCLAACTAQDEHYYRTNPQDLDKAIKSCPAQPPPQLSCEQLAAIASSVNALAYQLQVNPQGFGKQILSLQEALAKQEAQPPQSKLSAAIIKNKQQLDEYLAVVRWLESPGSR